MDLGKIAAGISADPSSFEAGCLSAARSGEAMVGKLTGAFSTLGKNALSVFDAIKAHPVGLLVSAVSGLVAVLGELEKKGIEAAKAQVGLERQFGLTNAQASGLLLTMRQSGGDIDTMRASLLAFNRHLAEAADGGNRTTRALERLGLDGQALAAGSLTDALGTVGDALNRVSNTSERASLSQAILGRQGQNLRDILRMGTEGMHAQEQAAHRLGLAMGSAAREIVAAQNAQRQASLIASQFEESIGGEIASALATHRAMFANYWIWRTQGEEGVRAARLRAHMEDMRQAQAPTLARVQQATDQLTQRLTNQGLDEFAQILQRLGANHAPAEQLEHIHELIDQIRESERALAQENAWLGMNRDLQEQYDHLFDVEGQVGLLQAQLRQSNNGDINDEGNRHLLQLAMMVEARRDYNQLIEASKGPLDRYHDQLANINYLYESGLIDEEQYAKAAGQAFEGIRAKGSVPLAQGLTAGSRESLDLFHQAKIDADQTQIDPMLRIEELTRQSVEQQRQIAENGRRLLEQQQARNGGNEEI